MFKSFCLLILIIVAGLARGEAWAEGNPSPPIDVADGQSVWPLAGHADFLQSASGALTFDDIRTGRREADFAPVVTPLSRGLVDADLWIRTVIDGRGDPAPVYLVVQPPVLSGITLFVEQGTDTAGQPIYLRQDIGNQTPLPARGRYAAVRAAPIVPLADHLTHVFIRLSSSTNLTFRGTLYSGDAFLPHLAYDNIVAGFCVGSFVLLTVLNLIHWLYIRDPDYARYGLFMAALSLFMLCSIGLGPDLFSVVSSDSIRKALLPVMLICCGSVVASATRARPSRLVHQGLRLCMVMILICVLLWPLIGFKQIMGFLYLPALGILLIGIIGSFRLALASRSPLDWLGTFAFSAPFAGVVILYLREAGYLRPFAWTDMAVQKGELVFAIFLTASMAIKTQRTWNEQRLAKDEALRLSRTSEMEALRLVETRTAELRLAKETAELALAAEQASKHEQIRFIDVVAHQFKTPLAIIKSNTATIMASLSPVGAENHARFTRIDRAINRLVNLLDITAHRSRLTGFAARPSRLPVRLDTFTRDVVATKSALMGDGRSIDITGSLPAVTVLFDPSYMELVLANLIDNALKFSSPHQPVNISCRYADSQIEWTVVDEGIGIPEDESWRVTERFFRASNSGGTVGMGIGLHMVDIAVRAHGGQVQFNRRDGQGTVAIITICAPVATGPA